MTAIATLKDIVSFSEIGRLYKGSARTKDGKMGKEQPFFRLELNDGTERPDGTVKPLAMAFRANPALVPIVEDAFYTLYTDKPEIITGVHFLANSPEIVFKSAFEVWTRKEGKEPSCITRCDGLKRSVWMSEGQIQRGESPCSCQPDSRQCKPSALLSIYLPQITAMTGVTAVFTVVTHSIVDIERIQGMLNAIYTTNGHLNKPFMLGREKGAVKGFTKYFIRLEPAEGLAIETAENMLEAGQQALPMLTASVQSFEAVSDGQLFIRLIEGHRQYVLTNGQKGVFFQTFNADLLQPFIEDILTRPEGLSETPRLQLYIEGNEILDVMTLEEEGN